MFALIAHAQQTTTQLAEVGYIAYGAGDFDGQSSGHDYMGVSAPISPASTQLGACWSMGVGHGGAAGGGGRRRARLLKSAYMPAGCGWRVEGGGRSCTRPPICSRAAVSRVL